MENISIVRRDRRAKKDYKFWFKSCPRCKGDLYEDTDFYGRFVSCIQCGYQTTPQMILSNLDDLKEAAS